MKSDSIQSDVVCSIFNRRSEHLRLGQKYIHNGRWYFQLISPSLLRIMNSIATIPFLRIAFNYFSIFLNACLLASKVNLHRYQIIHGHSTFINGLSALLLARIYKKTFVYDIHALRIDAYKRQNLQYKIEKFFENLLIRQSDAIILIDQMLKSHVEKSFNLNQKKIYVAPNGINTSFFKKTENKKKTILDQYQIPSNKFLIGLDASKPIEGFNYILENYKKIISNIENVHFIVFGSKRKNIYLQNFTFLPKIEYRNMPTYYSIVDLFILPRVKNAQTDSVTPLKLLELMSCEIPLIVSDVSGLTSCIKENKTGFIFKENDISDLIKYISYIATINNISEITSNARDWVNTNKSWDFAAQRYNKCYNYLMKIS